eukprot:TRINITY_DN23350_c0_g1_i1.p1 TRINITY_DN23350_c0_g1~~TRINITY_DN23350_c0_g1_i1.p1  ORF type:complete len:595 (+),score=203.83 TRINITY_DN23350_c0_g1_i1:52-1836(+)
MFERGSQIMKDFTREDVFAGVTVGVMAIPQSMAYAMLADLEPIYGLYTALLPPFIYALLGGSKQLHVGPVSMVSLLTATCIKKVEVHEPEMKAAVATLVALLAGIFQIGFGLTKLGSLVSFATLPIISGFTAGASVVVIVSQLQHIFGISVPSGVTTLHSFYNTVKYVLTTGFSPYSLVLGVLFLGMLWGAKHLSVKYPDYPALKAAGPLVVVCFGTAVTKGFELNQHGVAVIGAVPDGLPSMTSWGRVFEAAGDGPLQSIMNVVDSAFAISFISFMESIAVTKTLAVMHGYEVDANKELMALGTALISGSFFNGYGGAGAFSRSAVASSSGAKTQGAAMVAASIVGVTLLFLTPLFYYLPKGVLAAIVLHAVWGLIKVEDFWRNLELSKRDGALWMVAFLGTLYSVSFGLMFSVGISVCIVIKDTTVPIVERFGAVTLGNVTTYVPSHRVEAAREDPAVFIVGVTGMLHGGSVQALRAGFDRVRTAEEGKREGSGAYRVVIDMRAVPSMDTTALEAFVDLAKGLLPKHDAEGKHVVVLAGLQPDVLSIIESYLVLHEKRNIGNPAPFAIASTVPGAVFRASGQSSSVRSMSMV